MCQRAARVRPAAELNRSIAATPEMVGFVVRGFCGAALGAFFAMGLMFFELLTLPVILYWIVIGLSAVAWFLLAGFYGDRAFNWLKELWEWFGL